MNSHFCFILNETKQVILITSTITIKAIFYQEYEPTCTFETSCQIFTLIMFFCERGRRNKLLQLLIWHRNIVKVIIRRLLNPDGHHSVFPH